MIRWLCPFNHGATLGLGDGVIVDEPAFIGAALGHEI